MSLGRRELRTFFILHVEFFCYADNDASEDAMEVRMIRCRDPRLPTPKVSSLVHSGTLQFFVCGGANG